MRISLKRIAHERQSARWERLRSGWFWQAGQVRRSAHHKALAVQHEEGAAALALRAGIELAGAEVPV